MCDTVIETVLNIWNKTKDSLNARLDIILMKIREDLNPQTIGNKIYLPPACHTLSKEEKIGFCSAYKVLKFHMD